MLELNGVEKSYGLVKALSIQNMCFHEGIYGILGPNGAGKSTLIKILTNNIKSDMGSILYNGTDICQMGADYRKMLGYMPQDLVGYQGMRVMDFMEYMALLKGEKKDFGLSEKIVDILQRVHMEKNLWKRFKDLSGGMKRRMLFAQALLGNPKILILDEPTAGLDPKERIALRNLIAQEAENRIVLLATHIVSDIECTANQVLLLKNGEMKGCHPPEEWLAQMDDHVMEIFCTREESREIEKKYLVSSIRQGKQSMVLRIVGDKFPEKYERREAEATLDEVYLYFFEYQ